MTAQRATARKDGGGTGRQAPSARRRQRWFVKLFLLPALLPYLALYIYPSIHAFSIFTRKALNSGQRVFASPINGVKLLAIEPCVSPTKPQ